MNFAVGIISKLICIKQNVLLDIRNIVLKHIPLFEDIVIYTAIAGSGKVWPVNQVNNTSWVAVVTPTDRPKSVRNRCVIELFCGVVCVVSLPFRHFFWCRGFCHRTESDLFHFLLICSHLQFILKISSK